LKVLYNVLNLDRIAKTMLLELDQNKTYDITNMYDKLMCPGTGTFLDGAMNCSFIKTTL
jgi:hypothetical protein